MTRLKDNAEDLEADLAWAQRVIAARLRVHRGEASDPRSALGIAPPDHSGSLSEYGLFISRHRFSSLERLALVLALIPHVRPRLLEGLLSPAEGRAAAPWGLHVRPTGEVLPTGETLAFLAGGDDLEARFSAQLLFDPDHPFSQSDVLRPVSPPGEDLPLMGSPLRLSEEHAGLFTTGVAARPALGSAFPAARIDAPGEWDDLVLHPGTRYQVEEIRAWIVHGEELMNGWRMASRLRPGYRSLFYGPPGTGKSMTASLLGKVTGREAYKIDLALVTSKYVGETEKNLNRLLDRAERRGWILFFDEADALFGRRGETRDAQSRWANLEVSFLLQRMETFGGVAILASNLRENIDDAFARRFESVIHFPMPRPEERSALWRRGFSPRAPLAPSVDLERIARDHALSGGAIMNVIRHVSLLSLREGGRAVTQDDLLLGVRRELAKEGKGV